jgi:murein DD-endopeptidase MepM/ murein hydrolase activator NlpD
MARLPFDGKMHITSAYGTRTDPISGQRTRHNGLDIVGASYIIRAVCDGVVAVSQMVTDKSNATWQWGNYVCVQGNDGNFVYYCHMEERKVETGQRVKAGDVLGIMGTTGYSTGDHLHFEVRTAGNKVLDPAEYLGIPNEVGEVKIPDARQDDSIPAEWAKDAVEWAKRNGILYGDEVGNLRLREPCTREMAVVFLYRAMTWGGA